MLGDGRLRGRLTVLGFNVIGLGAQSHRIRRPGRNAMLVHLRQWLRLTASTSMFALLPWVDGLVLRSPCSNLTRRGRTTAVVLARCSSRAHGTSLLTQRKLNSP